jgi:XTP/dITP diphosphohydrolase
MSKQILYATTNPGKVFEVRKILNSLGLEMLAPADIGLDLDVPENGISLEENAAAKAQAYLDQLDGNYLILGDDTGVEIDALNGEPGIHVRRWHSDHRLTDQEIITYCIQRMQGIPPAKRGAQFRTVFALGIPGTGIELFDGTLRGVILEEPAPLRIEGFPFESLFFVPEWGRLLGDVHQTPAAQKTNYITHRERALMNALPRIRELLGE